MHLLSSEVQLLYLKGMIFPQITESFVEIQFYRLFQLDKKTIGII